MDADKLRSLIEERDARNGQELLRTLGGLASLAERLTSNLNNGLTKETAEHNRVPKHPRFPRGVEFKRFPGDLRFERLSVSSGNKLSAVQNRHTHRLTSTLETHAPQVVS